MKVKNFFLAGHSFGGYVVGNYALKYHKYIRKLILLSPIGIRVKPLGENDLQRFQQKSREVEQDGGAPPSFAVKMAVRLMWTRRLSPFGVVRFLGPRQTKKLIDMYLAKRQDTGGDNAQKEAVADYMF